MSISVFTIKILMLFLPGIIAFIILDTMTTHKRASIIHWFVYSALLGLLTYGIMGFFNQKIYFWKNLMLENPVIEYSEIVWAIVIAVIIGIILSYVFRSGILYRFCCIIGITTKHGFANSFDYMMFLYSPRYIAVTDWEKRIKVVGELVASSDVSDDKNELIIQNATVFQLDDLDNRYDVQVFYLSQSAEKVTIEIDASQ